MKKHTLGIVQIFYFKSDILKTFSTRYSNGYLIRPIIITKEQSVIQDTTKATLLHKRQGLYHDKPKDYHDDVLCALSE